MTFNATQTDGSTPPIPMSSAVVPGNKTPIPIQAGPLVVDSQGNTLAPVSMYAYNGNDETQGAKADSAATDSASAWSIVALLKGIFSKLAGTLTVSGSVTTSGTVTEANSSTISTNTSNISSATGAQADAAYTTGNGSIIALLKGLYTKLAGTLTVNGTVTSNIGTTNGLALDATLTGGSQKTKLVDSGGTNVATISAGGAVKVDNSAVTQPVSASSLPLPTGAAQEAGNLATVATNTGNVSTATGAQADAAYVSGNGSIVALLKGIFGKVGGTLTVGGAVTANAGANLNTSLLALESGGNLAGAKTDLDTIAGIVSGNKGAIKAADGDIATIGAKADARSTATDTTSISLMQVFKQISYMLQNPTTTPVSGTFWQTTQPVSASSLPLPTGAALEAGNLASLLSRFTDTYGTSTTISAGTTFSAIPLVSALAANSYATLNNNAYQDTFIVEVNVASAFVGTIAFYGLEPDGTTLQAISAHQRGTTTIGASTAINTGSALNQMWEGSIAGFKGIYVVCTSYTSGSASVQLGVITAMYAQAVLNTVSSNLTQIGGAALSFGQSTMANSLPVAMASNQSAMPVGVTAGTSFDGNSGTISANSLRTVAGGAATGTKSNVAGSASSGSILASNTARKGAMIYNDSTAILYLDLSGGTASSSSYSVQVPSQGFFELPGPNIYNGAITGIWASANGNARVTEFS